MKQRLLDVAPRVRHKASKALVHVPSCPSCGEPFTSVTSTMAALFRHGGHGADRQATTRYCVPCRFEGGSVVVETNPRKRDT